MTEEEFNQYILNYNDRGTETDNGEYQTEQTGEVRDDAGSGETGVETLRGEESVDGKSVSVIEVNNNKDNVEIVGWHYIDKKGLEKLKRQAQREDGQLLIQTSNETAAALSALPKSSSSDGKDTQNIPTDQEKLKIIPIILKNNQLKPPPNGRCTTKLPLNTATRQDIRLT